MQETIRLTAENEALRAVKGYEPGDLAQLGYAPAQGIEAGTGETHSGSMPKARKPARTPKG
jgi:hypothetical protein